MGQLRQVSRVDPDSGFLTDKATGLYMSQTRPYDPRVGRWAQPDRIGLLGRDTNLYRYCTNNPVDHTDHSGEAEEHTKGKRPSTKDQHTRPRPGRPTTKQRQKPGWVDRNSGTVVKCVAIGAGISIIIVAIVKDFATAGAGVAADPPVWEIGGALISRAVYATEFPAAPTAAPTAAPQVPAGVPCPPCRDTPVPL